jgi:pimeloyl-ACP methyl ester carboxylesterase
LLQVFEDDALVTPDRLDEYVAPLLRDGTMESLRSLLRVDGADWVARFAVLARSVKAPTLVLWGAQDRWIPPSQADLFVAAIAGSRKVVIDRCGHMPQEERPAEVLGLVSAFLAESEGEDEPPSVTGVQQEARR